MSALGTASSLCYVFIALILGLVYSGNHLGSVGGRPGDSTAQKIFGILNSLGNIAFAFGERGVVRYGAALGHAALGCARAPCAPSSGACSGWAAIDACLPASSTPCKSLPPSLSWTGFAQVLLEIQDTLRQPPPAQGTMRKVSGGGLGQGGRAGRLPAQPWGAALLAANAPARRTLPVQRCVPLAVPLLPQAATVAVTGAFAFYFSSSVSFCRILF